MKTTVQRHPLLKTYLVWCLPVLLSLLGCRAPETPPPPAVLTPPQLRVTKLTEGFAFGVKMALLPDGRFLITEKQTGFVRLVGADFKLRSQPVLDVAVNYASERGLLGIAAHPDFPHNPSVYIAYIASAAETDQDDREAVGDFHVARFRLTGTTAAGPLQTLIRLPARPGPYHNGGCLRFGPDGKLYVSLGELNRHANLNSQRKGDRRGKILRYNDDGTIPRDNPFGADNPVYVYGIRNAFGFAFETQGAGLFVSDNGANGHDRLSKALAGENLGWPLVWGGVDTWYERLAAWWLATRFRAPLWESFEAHVVPTAVQVLPNDLYGPNLRGRVLMSSFAQGHLLQFALDDATRHTLVGSGRFIDGLSNIVDVQLDPEGRVYVLTIKALYRLDPASGATPN